MLETDLNESERQIRGTPVEAVPTSVLVEEMLGELALVAREESRKLREQLKAGGKKAIGGGVFLGLGSALSLVGAIVLAGDAAYLLSLVMPLWVAALIIGGGASIIGSLLVYGAVSEMRKARKNASEVRETLTEDAEWVQEIFSRAKRHRANA